VVAGLPDTAGHACWIEWALIMESAEADAREEIRAQAERKARAQRLANMMGRRGL
jgi:hypothetical protein